MGKKVYYAKLHDGFFVPGNSQNGGGNFKDTLPPDNKTLPDLEMELQDGGSLLISWTYKTGARKVRRFYMIGSATVKGVLLDEVDVTETLEKAS